MTLSLQQTRLGINLVLTNLAQGFMMPDAVMRLIYPIAEVADYGGQTLEFDDSIYEVVVDDRDDDTPYPQIQDSYFGRPFTLKTKGLSYRVPDKKAKQMESLGINWGQRASTSLMTRAAFQHEVEAAVAATTLASYATSNRVSLADGSRFDDNVDPGPVIRAGKAAVASQIGVDPNVMILGRTVFDAMAENPYIKERIKYTSSDSVTEDLIAALYGFRRVRVCNGVRKVADGSKSYIFGNNVVMAYTNPEALDSDRLPYRPNGRIDIETPSYGYTYVYAGNPLMYNPYRDEDRGATVYKLDFDRRVVQTGTNRTSGLITHGYLIATAVG